MAGSDRGCAAQAGHKASQRQAVRGNAGTREKPSGRIQCRIDQPARDAVKQGRRSASSPSASATFLD
jgi:hypothetical protein